jgi:hypothetical protein
VSETALARLRVVVPVRLVDLSAEGLQFEMASSVRPGSLYDLKVGIGRLKLESKVKVVRCLASRYDEDEYGRHYLVFGVGAVFVDMAEEMRAELARWVADRAPGQDLKGELRATDE